MTTFLAFVCLLSLGFVSMLGNFWFTFGLWPQSWASFTFFWLVSIVLHKALDAVHKEMDK